PSVTTYFHTSSLHDALPIYEAEDRVEQSHKHALHRGAGIFLHPSAFILHPSLGHLDVPVAELGPDEIIEHAGHLAEAVAFQVLGDRKSTRLNSSHGSSSYAV